MSESYTPSYEPVEPLGEEPKDNKTMIIIIVVVAVILLCCCCPTIIGAIWAIASGEFASIALPALLV
jgi:hypothetical protein